MLPKKLMQKKIIFFFGWLKVFITGKFLLFNKIYTILIIAFSINFKNKSYNVSFFNKIKIYFYCVASYFGLTNNRREIYFKIYFKKIILLLLFRFFRYFKKKLFVLITFCKFFVIFNKFKILYIKLKKNKLLKKTWRDAKKKIILAKKFFFSIKLFKLKIKLNFFYLITFYLIEISLFFILCFLLILFYWFIVFSSFNWLNYRLFIYCDYLIVEILNLLFNTGEAELNFFMWGRYFDFYWFCIFPDNITTSLSNKFFGHARDLAYFFRGWCSRLTNYELSFAYKKNRYKLVFTVKRSQLADSYTNIYIRRWLHVKRDLTWGFNGYLGFFIVSMQNVYEVEFTQEFSEYFIGFYKFFTITTLNFYLFYFIYNSYFYFYLCTFYFVLIISRINKNVFP